MERCWRDGRREVKRGEEIKGCASVLEVHAGYGPEGLCGFFGFPMGSVHHADPGGVGGTVLHREGGGRRRGVSAWPPASSACVRCIVASRK